MYSRRARDTRPQGYVARRRGGLVTGDVPVFAVDEERGMSAVPELTVAGGAGHATVAKTGI